jgi:signal transduction histidine kinase/putative methionine-R-sulfoxide reductase with GAF domain
MRTPRWRLFPKYATLIIALVALVLTSSGAVSLLFSWREIQSHLVALQMEKAQGAAARIEQYILTIEHQLGWTAFPRMDASADPVEQRRIEYIKLLRQAPAITELVWIGADGRERLRVGRLAMDGIGAGTDLSREPSFVAAIAGKPYYGQVQFRKGTEPYMAIARPAGGDGGVTVADVNLKFVWDVVSRIKIGEAGLAYVVDATGTLIAHPDISLVLKKTDLKSLPQVAAVTGGETATTLPADRGRSLAGDEVFSASARIPALNWTVFVESPRDEAFAPLYATIGRMALLLVGDLLIAMAAAFFLARALVRPIQALRQGAERIGAGELNQRIDVKSGDELEALAGQFNQMGAALQASYADLERKVEARTAELSEALERQTATAEIFRVMSSSPTDVSPVLRAVAERAAHLCDAVTAQVFIIEGGMLHSKASHSVTDPGADRRGAPVPIARTSMTGRAVLEGITVHCADVVPLLDTVYPAARPNQERLGFRAILAVPLIREGGAYGAIFLHRIEPRAFLPDQIALVETFAYQASIAIENMRLLNETKEALERQTAIAELVKAMSRSTFQLQPVLTALIESASRLCRADKGFVYIRDGDEYVMRVNYGAAADQIDLRRIPPEQGSLVGRTALKRQPVAIADALTDESYTWKAAQQRLGYRSMLGVPMLRDGEPIGVIAMWREQVRPFSEQEQTLVSTFADQAVIAIENVRLFEETREALEQQTAAAEVLQVMSNSIEDSKPVFQQILNGCRRLVLAKSVAVFLVSDGEHLQVAAAQGYEPFVPMRLDSDVVAAMSIRKRHVLHFPDVLAQADAPQSLRRHCETTGARSIVLMPIRWDESALGAILAARKDAVAYTDKEIGLLRTFADQAAIAIQNARLFREIEDKSRQLEAANRHKSEFLANMSHELRTPLNAIIGFSEVLTEQMFGELNDKQMEYLKDIHSSGQHLLSLINDVLDLSKIEAGKMELDLSCFDLGLLLDHSTTLVRERAQRHGLTLELDVGDGLHEWVADARKVKQAVVNLLSNAVKFTPNGGKVTVRARHLNGFDGHAGEWAEVSVSDTGVGIKPEDQALVFEEFRQASGDVLRKAEGTGLGLALVKRFVELHGGAVRLESEVGRGSTFSFRLPQLDVDAVAPTGVRSS